MRCEVCRNFVLSLRVVFFDSPCENVTSQVCRPRDRSTALAVSNAQTFRFGPPHVLLFVLKINVQGVPSSPSHPKCRFDVCSVLRHFRECCCQCVLELRHCIKVGDLRNTTARDHTFCCAFPRASHSTKFMHLSFLAFASLVVASSAAYRASSKEVRDRVHPLLQTPHHVVRRQHLHGFRADSQVKYPAWPHTCCTSPRLAAESRFQAAPFVSSIHARWCTPSARSQCVAREITSAQSQAALAIARGQRSTAQLIHPAPTTDNALNLPSCAT